MNHEASTSLSDELYDLLGQDDLSDLPEEVRLHALDIMRRVKESGFDVLENLAAPPRLSRTSQPGSSSAANGIWANIIPGSSSEPSTCAPLVIAIAHKPTTRESNAAPAGRPRLGIPAVTRMLREHLIHCGCGPSAIFGRTALVFTDHWDRRRAQESRLDFAEHGRTGGLRYAFLLWDGTLWHREYL